MLRPLQTWLRNLPYSDPVQRWQAGLLQGIILVVLVGRLSITALEWLAPDLVPPVLRGAFVLAVVATLLTGLALLRLGRLHLVVLLMIALTILTVTRALAGAGLSEGGVVALGYVIAIALAGLILSRLSLIVVTGLCVAAVGAVAAAEPDSARGGPILFTFASYAVIIAALLDRYRVIWERSLEALRANEERLRLALDAGAMSTWDWDLRTRKLIWGGRQAHIVGVENQSVDASPQTFALHIHPDDMPGLMAATRESRQNLTPFAHEYRIILPDGTVRWAASRGRFLTDRSGAAVRMLGVIIDTTEQKEVEARLRAIIAERDTALARLQLVLDRTPIGVMISTADFRISYCNHAAERIFGWSAAEMVGTFPDERLLSDEVRERLLALAQQSDAKSTTLLIESENRRKDGTAIICEWHNTPLYDADGTFTGFLAMAQDVTERRRREQETRELNAELERRVAERTAELAAKNRELEVFAYSVSHDLKAPLRGIDGYSRLLAEDFAGRLDGDGPFYIAQIRAGVASMAELIDDLLAYSRVERRAMRLRGVAVGPIVERLRVELGDALARAGATLHVALPEMVVQAEEEGLALILRNLLENALKFSAGCPEPTIQLGGEVRDGSALLWVRDNGIGFAMEYHDRIFELFQRLHRAEDYPGTGIGLAIVRKAVERMGGSIWAESAPGSGACFYLRLPMPPEEEQ